MSATQPETAEDLDCGDLNEVRRRVVDPVISSLLTETEVGLVELFMSRSEGRGASPRDDAAEVWMRLTLVTGEDFESRICKRTVARWNAESAASVLQDKLLDWLPETELAWGENRCGQLIIPPPLPR